MFSGQPFPTGLKLESKSEGFQYRHADTGRLRTVGKGNHDFKVRWKQDHLFYSMTLQKKLGTGVFVCTALKSLLAKNLMYLSTRTVDEKYKPKTESYMFAFIPKF
jgi:hypothetical protein